MKVTVEIKESPLQAGALDVEVKMSRPKATDTDLEILAASELRRTLGLLLGCTEEPEPDVLQERTKMKTRLTKEQFKSAIKESLAGNTKKAQKRGRHTTDSLKDR